MGLSIRENRLVSKEISDVWPATLKLTIAAIVIAISIGVTSGIFSAIKPNSYFDGTNRIISLFGLSMPVFWIGLVMIVVFAYWLRLLPIGGTGSWKHIILPAVTLSLPSVAMISRMTRSSLLEVLKEDYVRTARAKGVSEKVVILKHAFKNALIPIVTMSGLQLGQLMGGAILTETVFAWPGLGRLMIRAIFARDYILLQGAVLVFALAFVLINLIVDISYSFLDPRVSYK
jgi:peptide/nickel transport system permease protein